MTSDLRKFNMFLFFKLPAAWWSGVRLISMSKTQAVVTVTHKWFNQNPFNSMFWAVQGMAAELSTGAMVIDQIKASGYNISMLVANNKANFSKKATGKITFICEDGGSISQAIENTIKTGEGQSFWMQSKGVNQDGLLVSTFDFEWTIKKK